jgi:antitoxin component of MazEF toxin-antitoxin module
MRDKTPNLQWRQAVKVRKLAAKGQAGISIPKTLMGLSGLSLGDRVVLTCSEQGKITIERET